VPIEIEKKYRLSSKQRELVLKQLPRIGAKFKGEEFEENILYGGGTLNPSHSVLRLRRAGKRAILTYKERYPGASSIKHQREDETEIENVQAMDAILQALGFAPILIYEKRRMTWLLRDAQIVVDDLPFGFFMEIGGSESEIREIEQSLAMKSMRTERLTYPQLTLKYGKKKDGIVEARFDGR